MKNIHRFTLLFAVLCCWNTLFAQSEETLSVDWKIALLPMPNNQYKVILYGHPNEGFRFLAATEAYKSLFDGIVFHGAEHKNKKSRYSKFPSAKTRNFKLVRKPRIQSEPTRYFPQYSGNMREYVNDFEIHFVIKVIDPSKPVQWESALGIYTDIRRTDNQCSILVESCCYGIFITPRQRDVYAIPHSSYYSYGACPPQWKQQE